MSETQVLDGVLEVNVDALVLRAESVSITTLEQRTHACEMLEGVLEGKQAVVDYHEGMRKKAYDAYQEVLTTKKRSLEPWEKAETLLRSRIGQYDLEERRRLQAAEEERRRQEVDVARKKREEEAAIAREQGKERLAEAIASAPLAVAPVVIPRAPAPATMNGAKVTSRAEYDYRITDANLVPREYCIPDEKAIRAIVKARKGNCQIPGVEVFEVADVTVRKAKKLNE